MPETDSLLAHYESLIAEGMLTRDAAQLEAATALHGLLAAIKGEKKRILPFGGEVPRGLYLWGGVGRGKTMLMDMAHDHLGKSGITAARFHFHEFMARVHDRIHDDAVKKQTDPARHVASHITGGAQLLCFDEMEIRDIADAMIIARVMTGFWEDDGVLIATSNRLPDDLYEGGLHRERFLPFIDLIKKHMDVLEIASPTDWRQKTLGGGTRWHAEADAGERRARLEATWDALTTTTENHGETIHIKGRAIDMRRVCGSIAFAGFDELCGAALAAPDYLAIADRYSGLFLADIPVLDDSLQNEARRFIWLVDALYDRGRFLVASAAAEIDALYEGTQWRAEFPRTASRLREMTSA